MISMNKTLLIFAAFAVLLSLIAAFITGGGNKSVGGNEKAPAFSLIDHNGEPFSHTDLAGKKALIFFGFTLCPDMCPTALASVTEALNALPPEIAAGIRPVFVTVDPERDTPEVINTYLSNFHPSYIGLTGESAPLTALAEAYKAYAQKVASEDSGADGYEVRHVGDIYLLDEDTRYLGRFPHNAPPDVIAGHFSGNN